MRIRGMERITDVGGVAAEVAEPIQELARVHGLGCPPRDTTIVQ